MGKNISKKKFTEEHPTIISIRKYEKEIAELEVKRDHANEAHDWTMRNWYTNQIAAKTKNMEILMEKIGLLRYANL